MKTGPEVITQELTSPRSNLTTLEYDNMDEIKTNIN